MDPQKEPILNAAKGHMTLYATPCVDVTASLPLLVPAVLIMPMLPCETGRVSNAPKHGIAPTRTGSPSRRAESWWSCQIAGQRIADFQRVFGSCRDSGPSIHRERGSSTDKSQNRNNTSEQGCRDSRPGGHQDAVLTVKLFLRSICSAANAAACPMICSGESNADRVSANSGSTGGSSVSSWLCTSDGGM